MRRFLPVLALIACAALLVGCTTTASQPQSVTDPTTPAAQLVAAAAPRPSGSVAKQASALAKAASGTGTAAQAALRTALVMSGFTLADQGRIVDAGATPNMGVEVPIGELQFVAGQNTYEHAQTVNDLAQELVLMDVKHKVSLATMRLRILDGLRNLEPPEFIPDKVAATYQFYAAFFADLGKDANPSWDLDAAGENNVTFTGLQVWLVWLGLAGGFARTAAFLHEGKPGPTKDISDVGEVASDALTSVPESGGANGCQVSDTQGKALDWVAMGAGILIGGVAFTPMGGAAALFPESENPGSTQGVGDALGWLNAALSLAHVIAESMTFEATVALSTESPLVRTKNLGDPGDQGKLKAHLTFNFPRGQYANCFRLALNAGGLDVSVPNNGPIKGSSVQWTMDNDPAGADNDPTEFYLLDRSQTGDSVQSKSDDDGNATMGLEGLGQRYILPPDPPPYIRTVTIRVQVELKANDLYTSLMDAVSAASAGYGLPASVVSALIDHAHAFQGVGRIQVKDWQKDFKIETHADYSSGGSGPEFPYASGIKCDGLAGTWNITGMPTFTLDKNGNSVTPGVGGQVKITYEPGDPAKLMFLGPYYEQRYTVIPGNFCKK